VRYELGFYIPEGGTLHSHRRENLKPYIKTEAGYPQILQFSFPILILPNSAFFQHIIRVLAMA
jgi:hypothetical protein